MGCCHHFWSVIIMFTMFIGRTSSSFSPTMGCNKNSWKENATMIVTCEFKKSEFSARNCQNESGVFGAKVQISFQSQGASQANSIVVASLVGCPFRSGGADDISCASSYDDASYLVTYLVEAHRSQHDGGSWLCQPLCFQDASGLNRFATATCGPVRFDGLASRHDSDSQTDMKLAIALGTSIPTAVIIIIVVIYFRRHSDNNSSANTKGAGQSPMTKPRLNDDSNTVESMTITVHKSTQAAVDQGNARGILANQEMNILYCKLPVS